MVKSGMCFLAHATKVVPRLKRPLVKGVFFMFTVR